MLSYNEGYHLWKTDYVPGMVLSALLSSLHLTPTSLTLRGLYLSLGKHSYYFHFLTSEGTGTQIG